MNNKLSARNFLLQNNIEFEENVKLDQFTYDFLVKDTLIVVALSAIYNTSWSPLRPPCEKYTLRKMMLCAQNHKYKFVCIFDWDNVTKVLSRFLENNLCCRASKLNITEISKQDADNFLDNYHLQSKCRGNTINIALLENNSVVSLMTFGKPRYNKNYQYELLRLVTVPQVIIYGGASKMFSHFIIKYIPESVISYCDRSKFSGKVYTHLGFSLKSSSVSRHWVRLQDQLHFNDSLVRQHGCDQLVGTSYGKGTSNEQTLLDNGFLPVWDCGQDTYVYKFE